MKAPIFTVDYMRVRWLPDYEIIKLSWIIRVMPVDCAPKEQYNSRRLSTATESDNSCSCLAINRSKFASKAPKACNIMSYVSAGIVYPLSWIVVMIISCTNRISYKEI